MATRILVGADRASFAHDRDSNGTWHNSDPLLTGCRANSIGATPGGHLVAGTGRFVDGKTIRLSDNAGQTWRQADHPPAFPEVSTNHDGTVRTLNGFWTVAHGGPAQPHSIYAGADEAAFFRSTDGVTAERALRAVDAAGHASTHSVRVGTVNTPNSTESQSAAFTVTGFVA